MAISQYIDQTQKNKGKFYFLLFGLGAEIWVLYDLIGATLTRSNLENDNIAVS